MPITLGAAAAEIDFFSDLSAEMLTRLIQATPRRASDRDRDRTGTLIEDTPYSAMIVAFLM